METKVERDECIDAMKQADSNDDGRIDRSEYTNLVVRLSPFPSCPNIGMTLDFLEGGSFGVAFSNLSCLCRRYSSDMGCCEGTKSLAIDESYPDVYYERICSTFKRQLERKCSTQPDSPSISPAPAQPNNPVLGTRFSAATPPGFNCESLSENLQVRWQILGDSIQFDMIGRIQDGEYMAFGRSGMDSQSFMRGADVVVSDFDGTNFRARDMYINGKMECTIGNGVCEDGLYAYSNDITDVSGEEGMELTRVRYTRSLVPMDINIIAGNVPVDREIILDQDTYMIWAIGPLNPNNDLPGYHRSVSREDVIINFGRAPADNCTPLADGPTEMIGPTQSPTQTTASPTLLPTTTPTTLPTILSTTLSPTLVPTASPVDAPTNPPTLSPSMLATLSPTISTIAPTTVAPTQGLTAAPTTVPTTSVPTLVPTNMPSTTPTSTPTEPVEVTTDTPTILSTSTPPTLSPIEKSSTPLPTVISTLLTLSDVPSTSPSPPSPAEPISIAETPPGFNCEPLSEDLQIRWRVQGDSIEYDILGRIVDGDYMAFGKSGRDDRPFMNGADVVLSDYDGISFRARDLHITGKSQCNNGNGVCEDGLYSYVNDISNVSGDTGLGLTRVRYTRPLVPLDVNEAASNIPVDRVIDLDQDTHMIWAIGPINPDSGLPGYHRAVSREDVVINFGRNIADNCSPIAALNQQSQNAPTEAPSSRIRPSGRENANSNVFTGNRQLQDDGLTTPIGNTYSSWLGIIAGVMMLMSLLVLRWSQRGDYRKQRARRAEEEVIYEAL